MRKALTLYIDRNPVITVPATGIKADLYFVNGVFDPNTPLHCARTWARGLFRLEEAGLTTAQDIRRPASRQRAHEDICPIQPRRTCGKQFLTSLHFVDHYFFIIIATTLSTYATTSFSALFYESLSHFPTRYSSATDLPAPHFSTKASSARNPPHFKSSTPALPRKTRDRSTGVWRRFVRQQESTSGPAWKGPRRTRLRWVIALWKGSRGVEKMMANHPITYLLRADSTHFAHILWRSKEWTGFSSQMLQGPLAPRPLYGNFLSQCKTVFSSRAKPLISSLSPYYIILQSNVALQHTSNLFLHLNN